MRHYTSIEQSKKLLELGIGQDTADMEYMFHRNDGKIVTPSPFIKDGFENTGEDRVFDFTPCWSVGALMELMPMVNGREPHLIWTKGAYTCFYYRGHNTTKETILELVTESNPVDACYEMVVWLLENGYIKK